MNNTYWTNFAITFNKTSTWSTTKKEASYSRKHLAIFSLTNYAEKSSSAILEPLLCSLSFLLWKMPLCLYTWCPPIHIHFNDSVPLLKWNTIPTLLAKMLAQKQLDHHHIVDRTRRWLPWMSWRKALATTSIRTSTRSTTKKKQTIAKNTLPHSF
jgi:hypothetical protein